MPRGAPVSPSLTPCSPSVLEVLATTFGSLADQCPSSDDKAQCLSRVVPRLDASDQDLLSRLLDKQTQAHIAAALGLHQSTISLHSRRLIARIRFWLSRPEAPPDDELVAQLVTDLGLDERIASLAVAYVAGASTADLTRLPAGDGLTQPAAWDRVRRHVPRVLAESEHPTARLMSDLLDHRLEQWPRHRPTSVR